MTLLDDGGEGVGDDGDGDDESDDEDEAGGEDLLDVVEADPRPILLHNGVGSAGPRDHGVQLQTGLTQSIEILIK